MNDTPTLQCPIPHDQSEVVQLAHGGSGRMAQKLIDSVFRPALSNPQLDLKHDAATIRVGKQSLAITTDAFVVSPWRFPGGNIGSLSIHGTVNDLAMAGAVPLALTATFVIEEGFLIKDLREIVAGMQAAALAAQVSVVAADTKVVERGRGDGIAITTTGIGTVMSEIAILPRTIEEGDVILLSGDVARHGIAVMTAREGLEVEPQIDSDAASVHLPVLALLRAGIPVHCLRDVTRGGLATILNEIANDSGLGIRIDETSIAVRDDVAGVCELLGLDPFYVACEGRFIAILPASMADEALAIMRKYEVASGAVRIGVVHGAKGRVTLKCRIGVDRILDLLSGEQLPRIC